MPRRSSVFGVPPSTIHGVIVPSAFLLSMWIHACGLIHSTLVTGAAQVHRLVGVELRGERMVSQRGGAGQQCSRERGAAITNNFMRMSSPLMLFCRSLQPLSNVG